AALPHRQQGSCLRHCQAQRLLAQHVFPGLRRFDRPRHVQVIRKGVVDRFNLGIGQQLLIRPVRLRYSQLPRGVLSPLQIPRRNRRDLTPFSLLHPRDHLLSRNRRHPQHSPLHLALFHHPPLRFTAHFYHAFPAPSNYSTASGVCCAAPSPPQGRPHVSG